MFGLIPQKNLEGTTSQVMDGMFHQLHPKDEHRDAGKKLPQIVIGGFQIELKLKFTKLDGKIGELSHLRIIMINRKSNLISN